MTIIPTSQISFLANLILQGNTLYFVFLVWIDLQPLKVMVQMPLCSVILSAVWFLQYLLFFFKKIRSKSKLTLFGYILPVLHYQWLCAITSLFFFQVAFRTGDFNHQVIFIGGLTDGLLATE